MSADNGIYCLQTRDGFRVINAQAIDNLYWWHVDGAPIDQYELRDQINPSALYSYFKNAEVLKDKTEAWHRAMILYRQALFVEYGIQFIEGFENIEFPKVCCIKPDIMSVDPDTNTQRCYNCGEYV